MRLRSSQLVFLMLLVCSVQIRQEYALQLIADAISGRAAAADAQNREVTAKAAKTVHALAARRPEQSSARLTPAALAAHRAAWAMPHPASASTAVASFTGLLRA